MKGKKGRGRGGEEREERKKMGKKIDEINCERKTRTRGMR